MPFGTILERTVLLTPRGWRRCVNAPTVLDLIGLDRAGAPQAGRVRLASSLNQSRVAFVGTATAAGEFSVASRLLLAAGDAADLRQVIATGSASDLQFETFRVDYRASEEQTDVLWSELRSLSASSKHDVVVMKCAGDDSAGNKRTCGSWLTFVGDGAVTYCVITRRRFADAMSTDADSAIIALANACFRREAENRWEFEADSTLLATWLLDALRRTGVKRSAQYDSLQHSCYLMVCSTASDPPPLGPGRCAFLSSRSSNEIRVEWSDPSWTPVVSGFLLSPEGH